MNELEIAVETFLSENPWIMPVLIWIVVWKGLALWRAARDNEKIWFIALIVVNTLGLLEIIYLAMKWFWKTGSDRSAE